MRPVQRLMLCLWVALLPGAVAAAAAQAEGSLQSFSYEIVAVHPHDPGAFTQGLAVAGGVLYEGTGLYGRSSLRRVDLETGRVLQSRPLPDTVFGEGITVSRGRIVQLTWKAGVGYVYRADDFHLQHEFAYPGEGWGLADDGARLVVSDGTAVLRFLDPETFAETGRLPVAGPGGPVKNLNELEYIDGRIYANVYGSDQVVIIDPATGRLTGRVDLAGLRREMAPARPGGVLNGIAYDAAAGNLYVTGKLWPRLFHIRLVPEPGEGR